MQDVDRQAWIGKLKDAMRVSVGNFNGVDKLCLGWAPELPMVSVVDASVLGCVDPFARSSEKI